VQNWKQQTVLLIHHVFIRENVNNSIVIASTSLTISVLCVLGSRVLFIHNVCQQIYVCLGGITIN